MQICRRETGVTDIEIVTSRMIDRSLRPMFLNGFYHEILLNCQTLVLDRSGDYQVAAINAASAALNLAGVPWHGPVGAVRLGCDPKNKNECIVNPTR